MQTRYANAGAMPDYRHIDPPPDEPSIAPAYLLIGKRHGDGSLTVLSWLFDEQRCADPLIELMISRIGRPNAEEFLSADQADRLGDARHDNVGLMVERPADARLSSY